MTLPDRQPINVMFKQVLVVLLRDNVSQTILSENHLLRRPCPAIWNQYFTFFIWPVSCDVTFMKTLSGDISSLEHDREMVDRFLNHKF